MRQNRRRFFFHYNKPLSNKHGKPIISLHTSLGCVFIDGDKFKVKCPTEGKVNKRQPHLVIQGWYTSIETDQGITIVK